MSSLKTTRYPCGCKEFDGVLERCHEHRIKSAPRCATCRWWNKRAHNEKLGSCEVIQSGYNSDFDLPQASTDSNDYDARLSTTYTFGCVLHEEKEG